MKYIVFSDLHDRPGSMDSIPIGSQYGYICLGDIFEKDPDIARENVEKLEYLKEIGADFKCVYGNHDGPVANDKVLEKWLYLENLSKEKGWGKEELFRGFYNDGVNMRVALEGSETYKFLEQLKEEERIDGPRTVSMLHRHYKPTPEARRMAGSFGYRIVTPETAKIMFENPEFESDILLTGHTHFPVAYRMVDGEVEETVFEEDGIVEFGDSKTILNPGSLENNRVYDGVHKSEVDSIDSRSYGVLDLDESTWEIRFV